MSNNDELGAMKYFMAAEKVGSLINSIENTLEFLVEFNIMPDEEVRKALRPCVDKLQEWIK